VPLLGIISIISWPLSLYSGEYLGVNLDEENNLKAWLAVYPMVCVLSIVKYSVMHESGLFVAIDTQFD
jgi:hypothetical protein